VGSVSAGRSATATPAWVLIHISSTTPLLLFLFLISHNGFRKTFRRKTRAEKTSDFSAKNLENRESESIFGVY
jgi:hypothetical protein